MDTEATADLTEIFAWVADQAGVAIADRYTDRLKAFCMRLAMFPERGRLRDDLRPGVRTVSFERRATIAFIVLEHEVIILGILHRGRDIQGAFHDEDL